MNNEDIKKHTQQWLNEVVIGLQLCPFAKKPFHQDTIRYIASKSLSDEERINELISECRNLDENRSIETTLIVYGKALSDFFDYSHFIEWANTTLKKNNWQGIYQIATFHPKYVFSNTENNDRGNLTNRSPYPIIHLLREETLQAVIESFPDTESIPEKNIETMNALTDTEIKRLFYYLNTL